MRCLRPLLGILAALATVSVMAQTPPEPTPERPKPKLPAGLGGGPQTVKAYIVTAEIEVVAPEMSASPASSPEVVALLAKLQSQPKLSSRFYLSGSISRQEILSEDFILPKGLLVMHKAGNQHYAIVDREQRTFLPMDAETVLAALEGGAGVENSQYDADVKHSTEKKKIAGLECRKSIVTVSYVSSIPFENDRVFVQVKNDIEVWHTTRIPSSAALEHLFFKFHRDKSGTVRQVLADELGFPMEINLVATQGKGQKASPGQPGSFHMVVTQVKQGTFAADDFRIPPKGYARIAKNPYFKVAAE
jgi:hypothetical protein